MEAGVGFIEVTYDNEACFHRKAVSLISVWKRCWLHYEKLINFAVQKCSEEKLIWKI